MKKITKKNAFTLVELLVVISIISILTVVSVSSYRTAQIRARDVERKASLDAILKSVMAYYNDNGFLPNEFNFGKGGDNGKGFVGPDGTIYMVETPIDPINEGEYVYVYKKAGNVFNLFANLENKEDLQCKDTTNDYTVDGKNFCYGVSSPNSVVNSWNEL